LALFSLSPSSPKTGAPTLLFHSKPLVSLESLVSTLSDAERKQITLANGNNNNNGSRPQSARQRPPSALARSSSALSSSRPRTPAGEYSDGFDDDTKSVASTQSTHDNHHPEVMPKVISIAIQGKGLPATHGNCDPIAIIYSTGGNTMKELGRSERLHDTRDPAFRQTVILPSAVDHDLRIAMYHWQRASTVMTVTEDDLLCECFLPLSALVSSVGHGDVEKKVKRGRANVPGCRIILRPTDGTSALSLAITSPNGVAMPLSARNGGSRPVSARGLPPGPKAKSPNGYDQDGFDDDAPPPFEADEDDETSKKKKADAEAMAAVAEAARRTAAEAAAAAKLEAEKKALQQKEEAEAKTKADEAAAAEAERQRVAAEVAKKKKEDEEKAAAEETKRKVDEEAAVAKKAAEEDFARIKKLADEEAAKKKADQEAAEAAAAEAKRKADAEAAEVAAKKKKEEEEAAEAERKRLAAEAARRAADAERQVDLARAERLSHVIVEHKVRVEKERLEAIEAAKKQEEEEKKKKELADAQAARIAAANSKTFMTELKAGEEYDPDAFDESMPGTGSGVATKGAASLTAAATAGLTSPSALAAMRLATGAASPGGLHPHTLAPDNDPVAHAGPGAETKLPAADVNPDDVETIYVSCRGLPERADGGCDPLVALYDAKFNFITQTERIAYVHIVSFCPWYLTH
jgi:hypothetical protein